MSEAGENQAAAAPRKKATSLSTMLLADLKALAGGLGIPGAGSMKKAQLVEAIRSYQDAHAQAPRGRKAEESAAPQEQPASDQAAGDKPASDKAAEDKPASDDGSGARGANEQGPKVTRRARGGAGRASAAPETGQETATDASAEGAGAQREGGRETTETQEARDAGQGEERRGRNRNRTRDRGEADGPSRQEQGEQDGQKNEGQKNENQRKQGQKQSQGEGQKKDPQKESDGQRQDGQRQDGQKKGQQRDQQRDQQHRDQQRDQQHRDQQHREESQTHGADFDDDEDGEGGSRRNRRRRGRERNANRQGGRNEPDTTILDDDVLVPAAGILDVLDNYAFVRTSGYLPGADDVYLSLSMVRKYGLRRGDAVVGQVRQPREGERREKFNPMVRIDQVNGLDPDAAKERPEFDEFVPVHPNSRLRLETGRDNLLGRIVDVLAPIGKGQRGMVLSPPRSGKTQVLQTIAASIRHNNPECHVMVVLIDERPEEVTDYQRTVKGEVVASTFDRPAADHVLLAELAVERAKRLVEMGHDVVVLLDSLTRLARAFNVAAPGSGRQGSGGVDAVALHPAKRLFGAARNVEDGGSLTILATALVESGSPLDEAVLDEFNDTANMELRLRRELVERRIFPPVDVVDSGTRREEHLLSPEEQAITFKLRSALMDLGPREALGRVLERMATSANNVEFLTQVQKASEAELSGNRG